MTDKNAKNPKTEPRLLMCRLTDDEQRVRGVELADAQTRLAELNEKKREIGDQVKDCQAKIDRLAETVKHRQEERSVACSLTPDYSADSMTIRRTDTGEIVAVRQLTHAERQPELPGTQVEPEPEVEANADTEAVEARGDDGMTQAERDVEAALTEQGRAILDQQPEDIRAEVVEYMADHPKSTCCQALAQVKRKWNSQGV